MKKSALCLLAAVSFTAASYAQKTTVKKPNVAKTPVSALILNNAVDSFSYAAGYSIAKSMKSQGVPNVNTALVQKAIEDVFKNSPSTLLNEEQCNMTLQQKLQEFAQKKMEGEKAKGNAFLEANKKKPGVTVLPNGLQYTILKKRVTIHYFKRRRSKWSKTNSSRYSSGTLCRYFNRRYKV